MPNAPILYGPNDTGVLTQRSLVTKDGRVVPSINYINNSDFARNNTIGWATYADAAASTPVDGTGGSPTSTFATTSTNPLRDFYSGLLTKSAVNRQGEGVSCDFTIPRADRSKSLSISFDFEVASGTYAAGDVGAYIYDVTNSTLITPSSVNIASGSGAFNASFVATTSTSYRLILHIATASASAYTLAVDNVRVGVFSTTLGFPGTNWQSYTPVSQGFGTIASVVVQWRQVGDSFQVRGRFVTGICTVVQAQLGIPSSTTDSAKLGGSSQIVGKWWRGVGGGTAIKQGNIICPVSTSYVQMSFDDTTAAVSPLSPQNANTLFGNGEDVSFLFEVPVTNLSSNVTMADRAVEEFAINSSTTNADDTTNFAYGAQGGLVPITLTAGRLKTVRFQTPVQPTDQLFLEVLEPGNTKWTPHNNCYLGSFGYVVQNTTAYGIYLDPSGGTDVDVIFSQYARPTGATYGIAGSDWGALNTAGLRWRVRKVSGGASVGFPVSARNLVGDVSGTAVPAGQPGERPTEAAATSATINAVANLTSITLQPGDFMLHLLVAANGAGGAADYTQVRITTTVAPTITGGALADDTMYFGLTTGGRGSVGFSYPVRHSVTTTYYLHFNTIASGATNTLGRIRPVRIA